MFALFIKFAFFHLITSTRLRRQSNPEGQREIKPLDATLKEYLQSDTYTAEILTSIIQLGLSNELKSLLHLSLNNLLITNSVLASSNVENYSNRFSLNQSPDIIQQELETRVLSEQLDQTGIKEFQSLYRAKSNILGEAINAEFGTNYDGGFFVSKSSNVKESLADLLSIEEIINPVRKLTVHTLLSRFLGTLQLSSENVFDRFPDDQVNFNIDYWKGLMTVYKSTDRKFLGKDNSLFLILRFVLQGLAQTRISRVSVDNKLTTVQEQLRLLQTEFLNSRPNNANGEVNSPRNEAGLSSQLNTIIETLSNIEAFRRSDLNNLQSTLITACASKDGSGDSYPYEDNEDTENGENPEVCPPCGNFTIKAEVAKHLRMCPSPKIHIPSHFSSLMYTYRDVETSVNSIKKTVDSLSNDHLLTEIQELNSYVQTDLRDITLALDDISSNYNNSIQIFRSVEHTIETVHEIYTGYHLYLILYIGMAIIGTVLAIQIIIVIIKIVKCYPSVKNYLSDWSAFREARSRQRQERADMQIGQALPLVPRRLR